MTRPRLLDLFCGAGGAAMGYHRAGFDVVGVDIKPQPRYPFEFIQADAFYALKAWGYRFNAVHASPPCQAYSWAAKRWDVERDDLLAPTRSALIQSGMPWVIENVVGAPMGNYVTLCGTMFGLGVIRHRLFESSQSIALLRPPCAHVGSVGEGDYVTVAGHGGNGRAALHLWKDAMGIDWMKREELTQAIPPAYTEYIGRELMRVVAARLEVGNPQ